jgi:outer membrane protein insertion porin family
MMRIRKLKRVILALLMTLAGFSLFAQEKPEIYNFQNESYYIIGGVSISGVRYLDLNALLGISGLRIGQEITLPGEDVTNAAKKLWEQGLFSDVRISIVSTRSDTIFLDVFLQERPRVSAVKFNGIRSSDIQDITENIRLPDHLLYS